MKVAFDTNVLAFAEGIDGPDIQGSSLTLVASLKRVVTCLPVQVLGELHRVLQRKGGRSPAEAAAAVAEWAIDHQTVPTTVAAFENAMELAARHGLQTWDSIILSTAADAGCGLLLSEDMHEGFAWRGCTVVNPFADPPHPLLANLLEEVRRLRDSP